MDANTPILRPNDLLPLLGTLATPTASPEPEEPPRGLLRRALDAWRDPEGRELTCRDFGDYRGPWFASSGWWTGGEQIGLGVTAQRDERIEWNRGSSRKISMLMIAVHIGPVSWHLAVERTDA